MGQLRAFWPDRRWWLALGVLLLLAGGLRYVGYRFSLPYIDHADEPNWNLSGRAMIDFGSAKPLHYQGYPPGIITLNYVLLRFFQDPADPPGVIIPWVRLIAITASMGTIAIIGLLAYRLAGELAGLVAAGLWAVSPIAVEHSRYATADPFVTFLALLALFCALSATLFDRDRWATWGVVAMMLAIVFKYQAVFLLPLVWALPLWRLYTMPSHRRHVMTNAAYNVLYLALFFFWLIAIYPALEANDTPNWVAPTSAVGLPTWDMVRINWHSALDPLWRDWELAIGGLGLALVAAPAFRKSVDRLALATVGLAVLAWWVGISLFGYQEFRQFITMGALTCILLAVGFKLWADALAWLLGRVQSSALKLPRPAQIATGLLVLALILANYSGLDASIANARNHTLPDQRNAMAAYMDTSLTPGPYIGDIDQHKTFNRSWGGYPGEHEFPLAQVASITDRPLDDWRAQGVKYAIVPYATFEQMQATPEGRGYLDDMLLLKTYPPGGTRGPSMAVFRLTPIQHDVDRSLGPVRLIGYDLDRAVVVPGDSLTFTLYWRADAAPAGDYTVYTHLTPLESREIVAQVDGPPLVDTRRSTKDWTDPDETLVSRTFTLSIGADVPPGDYQLITGFYRADTWERLVSDAGQDYVLVSHVLVRVPGSVRQGWHRVGDLLAEPAQLLPGTRPSA